jgi:hypothetical protein
MFSTFCSLPKVHGGIITVETQQGDTEWKVLVAQAIKKFPAYYEFSVQCSQEPSTGHPEPAGSVHTLRPNFKTHFNIILLSITRIPKLKIFQVF